jgi:hypothetical protein
MTLEEVEVTLKKITDQQIVQGELLNRVEQVTARNSEAIAHLADGMQTMQSAMQRLFEHMDRFIRGLEGNGRRGA